LRRTGCRHPYTDRGTYCKHRPRSHQRYSPTSFHINAPHCVLLGWNEGKGKPEYVAGGSTAGPRAAAAAGRACGGLAPDRHPRVRGSLVESSTPAAIEALGRTARSRIGRTPRHAPPSRHAAASVGCAPAGRTSRPVRRRPGCAGEGGADRPWLCPLRSEPWLLSRYDEGIARTSRRPRSKPTGAPTASLPQRHDTGCPWPWESHHWWPG
jgi:hypothetical protein